MRPEFFHVGGDIIWNGDTSVALAPADIDYLKRVYRDECLAAVAAGDEPAFVRSKALLTDLLLALAAQLDWMRCARAPQQPQTRAA